MTEIFSDPRFHVTVDVAADGSLLITATNTSDEPLSFSAMLIGNINEAHVAQQRACLVYELARSSLAISSQEEAAGRSVQAKFYRELAASQQTRAADLWRPANELAGPRRLATWPREAARPH